MYDTSNFLRRIGERLTVNVSESTISETENLLTTDRSSSGHNDLLSIQDIFDLVVAGVVDLTIIQRSSFTKLHPVNIPSMILYNVLTEIVANARQHASKDTLIVSSQLHSTHQSVRFSNQSSSNELLSTAARRANSVENRHERGSGLDMIRNMLAGQDIDVMIRYENGIFSLEMFIPLSKFE
jgi:hypothetical protein